jgi:hypothetical protein
MPYQRISTASSRAATQVQVLLLAGFAAYGQTQVDLRTQSKSIDFSAAAITKPVTTGNALPPVCGSGQMYFLLTAPPGSNLYACIGVNQWSLEGGASALPPVNGNGGEVLSTDGTNLLWTAPDGDITGPPGSTTVTAIQGRSISPMAPSAGQTLIWNPGSQSWQPQTLSGGGGATLASQLGDFSVIVATPNTLTIGQNCSVAAPCNFRFGSVTTSIAAPASITLNSGSGVLYLYAANNGTLVAGSTLNVACTAVCIAQSGVNAFPAGSLPLFTVTATSGAWNANGISDMRAFQSAVSISSGAGLVAAASGSGVVLSADPSAISLKVAAPSVSASSCTVATWATDGNFYYLCVGANQWKRAALSTW